MSRDSIFMDYRDTMMKADRLEELAGELRRIAEELRNPIADDYWQGEAKSVYEKKNSRLYQRTIAHAAQLDRQAKGMRDAATRLYQVEKWAAQQAGLQ